MVMLGDGLTYGFSGDTYWRMNNAQALDQAPVPLSSRWNCKNTVIVNTTLTNGLLK